MKNALEKYCIGEGLKKFFRHGSLRLSINKLRLIMSLATVVAVSGGRAANPPSDGSASFNDGNYWESIQFTHEVGNFKVTMNSFENHLQSPSSDLPYSFSTQHIKRFGRPVIVTFKSGLCVIKKLREAFKSVENYEKKTIKLNLSYEELFRVAQENIQSPLTTAVRKSALLLTEMDKENQNEIVVYNEDMSDCEFTITVQ